MSRSPTRELLSFLRDELDGGLRSLTRYTADEYEILYLRDDVRAQYTDAQLDAVVDDQRLETVDRPHQESLFEHGELQCTVRCFEGGIEMNFAPGDGEGVAVALDANAFRDQHTFLGRCRDVVR